MYFVLTVTAKKKALLKIFFKVLKKIKLPFIELKLFLRKNDTKFITILKSPHVNKTAQEQYEFREYKQSFVIFVPKPGAFVLFLKKFLNSSSLAISFTLSLFVGDSFLSLRKKRSCLKVLNVTKFRSLWNCYDILGEFYISTIKKDFLEIKF